MRKYLLYFVCILFLFLGFRTEVFAKTEKLICKYDGVVYNAQLRIFTDNSYDLNVEQFSHSSGNTDNDEQVLNWSSSFYSGMDMKYNAFDAYSSSGKCAPYMVYGELVKCWSNCTYIFLADSVETANHIKSQIESKASWQNDDPNAYMQPLSEEVVANNTGSKQEGTIINDDGEEVAADCSLFSGGVDDLLKKTLNIFRFLAPILLLVFSSVDFLKAATAQDKEGLKTAGVRLLKRCIICIVLFFVPTVINILLEIIGNSIGTCGVE